MPLMEHLREFRTRLVRALLAIVVGTVIAWIFYQPIFDWLMEPYSSIRPALEAQGINTNFFISGVGGAFQFQLKVSLIVGLLMASPFWFWQMWAFVLPAMHSHEKRTAIVMTGVGAPLFIAGAYLAYFILPTAIEILIGFVPDNVESLLTGAEYLSFILRMMLVFGVAAEIPLIVVLLNQMNVVSSAQLAKARPWIIIGIFVFAAVATPTVDPLTMLFLAIPMAVLYLIAEVIAKFTDRRRAKRHDQLDDDEASDIEGPDAVEGPDEVYDADDISNWDDWDEKRS